MYNVFLKTTHATKLPIVVMEIQRSDAIIMTLIPDVMRIKFDFQHVIQISINRAFQGQVTGLCGLRNDDPSGK